MRCLSQRWPSLSGVVPDKISIKCSIDLRCLGSLFKLSAVISVPHRCKLHPWSTGIGQNQTMKCNVCKYYLPQWTQVQIHPVISAHLALWTALFIAISALFISLCITFCPLVNSHRTPHSHHDHHYYCYCYNLRFQGCGDLWGLL